MRLSWTRRIGAPARAISLLAALLATPSLSALAQSVTPNTARNAESGGPLGGQTQPGVRPPKAQSAPGEALPGGRLGPPGLPQAIRWTENWTKPAAPGASLLERIRHIQLGNDPDYYLSIGGEVRAYFTDWNHSALGRTASDNNNPLQSRLRLITDLHLSKYFRGYIELGDNREYFEHFVTPPNRDRFDLYQVFADVTLPLDRFGKVTLRPGRFEMPLGNGKLVGLREGLDMRFTYEGLRATYILPGKISIDTFAVRPINIRPSEFDDRPDYTKYFKGVYASIPHGLFAIGNDLYWYKVERNTGVTREATGRDQRNNWGARIWTRSARWDLDLEGDYQSGVIKNQDIDAWAILFEGGYTFTNITLAPRLGLKANAFSGDGNLKNHDAGTFVPAFPRLPLISEAAFFNLSNLVDVYPSVTVKPLKDVLVVVGPDFLWRENKADGIYIGPNGASFAPYAGSAFIGTDYNVEASWQVTKRFQTKLFETLFSRGDDFKAHGGRNGNYFGLLGDYRF